MGFMRGVLPVPTRLSGARRHEARDTDARTSVVVLNSRMVARSLSVVVIFALQFFRFVSYVGSMELISCCVSPATQLRVSLGSAPRLIGEPSARQQLLRLVDGVLYHDVSAEPKIDGSRRRDLRLRPHRVAELELEQHLRRFTATSARNAEAFLACMRSKLTAKAVACARAAPPVSAAQQLDMRPIGHNDCNKPFVSGNARCCARY